MREASRRGYRVFGTGALSSRPGSRPLPPNVRRLRDATQARRAHEPTPTPPPATVSIAPTAAIGFPLEPRPRRSTSWGHVSAYILSLAAILFAWHGGGDPIALSARTYVAAVTAFARLGNPPAMPKGIGASLLPAIGPEEGEHLNREGHVSIPGGVLFLPSTLKTDDGAYDLLLHFHGNTAVVRESVEASGLNAAVAIVNLGIGSAPYEELYGVPGTYEELLQTIDRGLAARGVDHPRLRRVALSGWSAGYGSISTILQVRRGREDLDAVLIFDGIHCGWENEELNPRQMKPFVTLAERAKKNEIFFGITHSAIDPIAYASTTATASYLLAKVGGVREERDPVADAPAYARLESMKGAVSPKLEKTMEPTSEARIGAMHVVGYRGDTKEHHMAHLFQMSKTLLPELKARWEATR